MKKFFFCNSVPACSTVHDSFPFFFKSCNLTPPSHRPLTASCEGRWTRPGEKVWWYCTWKHSPAAGTILKTFQLQLKLYGARSQFHEKIFPIIFDSRGDYSGQLLALKNKKRYRKFHQLWDTHLSLSIYIHTHTLPFINKSWATTNIRKMWDFATFPRVQAKQSFFFPT